MDYLSVNPSIVPIQAVGPDPVESLQTDVMRFMAILCLCLVAIFSLVQSLPLVSRSEPPKVLNQPLLARDISALQKKARSLRLQVEALQTNEKAAQASLDRATAKIQRSMENLSTLKEQIKDRKNALAGLSRDVEKERRKLKALEAEVAAFEPNGSPEPVEVPKKDTSSFSQAPAEQKGFTLSFRSGEILSRLIELGQVRFFALFGDKTWKLGIKHGAPVFSPSPVPGKIYEMQPATVPEPFLMSFKKTVSVFNRDRVTWGVVLPAETQKEIQHHMTGRSGGSLVIQGDGHVIMEN